VTNPIVTNTYRTIAARLTMLRPQIDLSKYFAGPNPDVRLYDEKSYIREQLKTYGVAAATNTLDGLTFLPKDWQPVYAADEQFARARARFSPNGQSLPW